ncbi:hypothetical protein Dimus_001930 [Dionaea muscipula]
MLLGSFWTTMLLARLLESQVTACQATQQSVSGLHEDKAEGLPSWALILRRTALSRGLQVAPQREDGGAVAERRTRRKMARMGSLWASIFMN